MPKIVIILVNKFQSLCIFVTSFFFWSLIMGFKQQNSRFSKKKHVEVSKFKNTFFVLKSFLKIIYEEHLCIRFRSNSFTFANFTIGAVSFLLLHYLTPLKKPHWHWADTMRGRILRKLKKTSKYISTSTLSKRENFFFPDI